MLVRPSDIEPAFMFSRKDALPYIPMKFKPPYLLNKISNVASADIRLSLQKLAIMPALSPNP